MQENHTIITINDLNRYDNPESGDIEFYDADGELAFTVPANIDSLSLSRFLKQFYCDTANRFYSRGWRQGRASKETEIRNALGIVENY
jgi:hypothetical protein